MKRTLNTTQMIGELLDDNYARWSRPAAEAIIGYLEQLEEDCGQEIEFDAVGIRCDFSEYLSAVEAAGEYTDEEMNEEEALEYLRDRTAVIPFTGGCVIQDF